MKKSINLFLMDGTADGRYKATVANWNGVAYKIPRISLKLCKDREDLKQSGVYFLFGVDDQSGKPVVYIGQAVTRKNEKGLLGRLEEHNRNPEKSYWTEAVVFTTSNNVFGPTEISFLENYFHRLASSADRYLIKNGNEPNVGHVTEEKESELEEFAEYAGLVMGVFGKKVFEPIGERTLPETKNNTGSDEPILYIEASKVKARGRRSPEGFVLFKGSRIDDVISKSCPDHIVHLRKEYEGEIKDNVLQKDILLNSPSAAASFACGASKSGNAAWKTAEGVFLKELEND